ncbi:TIGR03118 family protein [Scleromatobacter humisilvae]|uniref:TIGR03118 family protein n=1 Tax=Scleromatobacter humisilvae TaxID=2897159 RepID=A0A9X2C3W9_9BURK|nr:TIGR03118 family protein [Scleromatobacter humisilvae]MCK9688190.1 TIGR03118 family protein [Scleromatobacter humisilvae]
MRTNPVSLSAIVLAMGMAGAAMPGHAVEVSVRNLVTDDQAANPAQITDPGLVNAWGISYSSTSPFWVSSNGGGTSTLYRVDPATQATTKVALTVTIPGAGNVTGQVFNGGGASQFNGDNFLFVSEDGTVSGWRGSLGTTAETLATTAGILKGAAIASVGGNNYLYAADFGRGSIDVIRGNAGAAPLTGSFTDAALPSGYSPFNIQALGGSLFVTYAERVGSDTDETAGAGLGVVDRYDLQGNLIGRVATGGALNAPWGLAIAPSSFGALAGSLLVGNFGDGRISAYNLTTDSFMGQLDGSDGNPLSIDGLWGLSVGNDGGAGSSQSLYFTAGPSDESHGLFGVMQAVPEPGSLAMLVSGLLLLGRGLTRRAGRA